jgi:uncharacterized membrane protein
MKARFTSRLIGSFSIPALLLGLVFFATSLTPSLIPRGPEVQGVLGGLVTAIGYLCARIVALLWLALDLPRLPSRLAQGLTWVLAAAVVAVFLWVLGSTLEWQNDLRGKMGMAPADALHLAEILALALLTFAAAYGLGRLVASLFRLIRARFYRVMPPRRANVLGFVAVMLILIVVTRDGILDRVVAGLDESYELAQALFDDAPSGTPITRATTFRHGSKSRTPRTGPPRTRNG